jgi:outer membrane protein
MIRLVLLVGMLLPAALVRAQSAPPVLTLAAAVDTARARAPENGQARASLDAARARVEAARSPLLPQVTGTLGYERSTFNGGLAVNADGAARSRNSLETRDQWSAALRASQLVYDFGQTRDSFNAAKANAHAERHNVRASWLAIEYSVRSTYLDAAAARAQIGVARESLDNQQRHLDQIQGFVEVGTRPAIDLAQGRTDVANARLALLRAESEYAIAKTRLERAMGHKPLADYDVSETLPEAEPDESAGVEQLLAQAEKNRPEFAALDQQLRAAGFNVSANQGAYGPSLGVQADVAEAGRQLDELAFNMGAGVTLSWPIFQGGLTDARVDEARAQLAGLRSQRESLLADARQELQQALLSLTAAQSATEIAQEVVVNAVDRLSLAEGRYAAGVGSIIELADAQLVLSTARSARVSADYEVAQARAALRRALGR